jgi:catechol 2,3-dioxygenase-like lactoylglutathione lyase family enzyme
MTQITGVRTVAVPVADQDRALAFYRDTLGFEVRMDAPIGPGVRWIEVAPPGAPTSVALAPASDTAPAGVDTGIRLSTGDAAADHAALAAQGADVDDEVMITDFAPPMFTFRDADANQLVVVQDA